MRRAFVFPPVTLPSVLGELTLGVVDADQPGVAAAVSRLLNRSIEDAREAVGGHLPDWLVDDIQRNYISEQKVKTLWAATGHRFVVLHGDDAIGTIHIARDHDVILTVDRHRNNVPSSSFPDFKPERHHHVVNISVRHELRRARIGRAMVDGIIAHFRRLFDGDGLWVRADPPWHPGLVGLGFVHDPSMDIFLGEDVARTAGLPHVDFNARYTCDCVHPAPAKPEALADRPARLQRLKLQYHSLTRAFDAPAAATTSTTTASVVRALDDDERAVLGRDWGGVERARPQATAMPTTAAEVQRVLRSGPVVVRGRGHSADGQSLGDDVVLQTAGLSSIVVRDDEVTVGAGVTWTRLVEVLAPHGRYPPVLTGWLPATVGGTLSVGGYSKGSHRDGLQTDHVRSLVVVTGDGRRVACSRTQAAWLFEAVLGGLGRFGTIVEATVPLVRRPAFVRVRRTDHGDNVAAFMAGLAQASSSSSVEHVTAFRGAAGWSIVTAEGTGDAVGDGVDTFARYVAPARVEVPPGSARWFHAFVPGAALPAVLQRGLEVLRLNDGDGLQLIPIRVMQRARASLLQLPAVDVGEVVFGLTITRELRGRDVTALDLDGEALLQFAVDHGATRALTGAPPRGEAAWRAHLGARFDDVARVKAMADPAGVLGPFTR